MKTAYTLGTPRSTETMTTTMLSLDKQSREEVASIFNGETTFHFTTMSTFTPFMKDRTAETRKYIQSPRLTLAPDGRNWDAIFTEQGISIMWNRAFSSFPKLSNMNIQKLCIRSIFPRERQPQCRKRSTLKRNMNYGGFLRPRCLRRRRMMMVRTHCCVVVLGTLTYPPSIQFMPPHQDLSNNES